MFRIERLGRRGSRQESETDSKIILDDGRFSRDSDSRHGRTGPFTLQDKDRCAYLFPVLISLCAASFTTSSVCLFRKPFSSSSPYKPHAFHFASGNSLESGSSVNLGMDGAILMLVADSGMSIVISPESTTGFPISQQCM